MGKNRNPCSGLQLAGPEPHGVTYVDLTGTGDWFPHLKESKLNLKMLNPNFEDSHRLSNLNLI